MVAKRQTTTSRRSKVTIPVLPRAFDLEVRLRDREQPKTDVRFFGNVLGAKGGAVFVETDEGIYEFKQSDIKDLRPLHKALDMVVLSRDAKLTLHGTLSLTLRANLSDQQTPKLTDEKIDDLAKNKKLQYREIVDTLGGLGVREWRG